jgi:MoxR-like ATPase
MNKLFDRVKALETELNAVAVERTDEIEGALAALISSAHKSYLSNLVCQSVLGSRFFQWLLTRFSTPEELFGPVSLRGMEQDEYRRVTTNKLPEAEIAFVDEIFKANSAILNSLLTLINERKYHNGQGAVDCPLLTCFGASNELPQGEELSALYDRFLLRYWVGPIQDPATFKALASGKLGNGNIVNRLTLAEVQAIQAEVKTVDLPDDILDSLVAIRKDLSETHGIRVSDRRWKSACGVLKAFAWLRGRSVVNSDDLETLADMLWHRPEDRKTILGSVSPFANPLNLKAIEFGDASKEIFDRWSKASGDTTQGIQASKALKEILAAIDLELKDRPASKIKKLTGVRSDVETMQKQIMTKLMG